MRNRRRGTVLAGALTSVLLAAGCGIPMQDGPQALPANVLPAPLPVPSPSPSPSLSPSASTSSAPATPAATESDHLRLWFVVDDGLAAAESTLPVGSSPEEVLEALAAGPDLQNSLDGLRTIASDPLTGQPLVVVDEPTAEPVAPASSSGPASPEPTFGPTPAAVTVRVSSAFTALPPAEQVLLLAQVVLSLAGAGERSVAFTDEAGTSLAVPLPDGRLLDVPATARDYSALIVQP